MSTTGTNVVKALTNAPLPLLIEKLGLAVATAQKALDENSIKLAQAMAVTPVKINGNEFNLISLGFAPTFYAFTEATVEAKLEFSLAESTSFDIGGGLEAQAGVVAVSVSASYGRKYEMSAEGSSSIAARLVSLPAPERFNEVLTDLANNPVPEEESGGESGDESGG